MERSDLLLNVKALIPANKTLQYVEKFVKTFDPRIGVGQRLYSAITRKYLYVPCWAEVGMENGNPITIIKKYPVCYPKGSGQIVKRVRLDELSYHDLNTLLQHLSFYHYWMSSHYRFVLQTLLEHCDQSLNFVNKGVLYRTIYISDIVWDTDGEDVDDLPTSEMFTIRGDNMQLLNPHDVITDYLSDKYGFLVENYNYNVNECNMLDIDKIEERMNVIDI